MKDTFDALKIDKKSWQWMDYVDYLNTLVVDGIAVAICSSLDYLADQISIEVAQQPIFDVKVELKGRELTFQPPMTGEGFCIYNVIFGFVSNFIEVAQQINRLDGTISGGGLDYMVEIKDHFQIYGSLQKITKNLKEMGKETNKFITQYEDFSFLWREDLEESF